MVSNNVTASNPPSSDTINVKRPAYLHEKEVQDAIRVVSLIAAGRNPFSEEPFDKLRPDQKDSVLQALCIVVSAMAHGNVHRGSTEQSWAPSSDTANRLGKRPLEEYLIGVERQAILEALKEAKHNKTAAARLLGITFRALRYRMESLGIDLGGD